MHRALLVAACLLLLAGCDETPTDPDRTVSFTGVVEKGKVDVHTVSMQHTGNLRANLLEVKVTAADGIVTDGTSVLLGIGSVERITTSTDCTVEGSFVLAKGTTLSLGLEKGNYCLAFSEAAALADGAKLTYSVRADITE